MMTNSIWLKKLNKAKYLILLAIPGIIYYLLLEYAPMFGLVVAFKDYSVIKGFMASPWVGFKYFHLFIFENPDFLKLLRNTFLLGFYSLVWGFPAPILLALLMNEIRFTVFKRFVQSVSYLPHFISNVIIVSMVVMFLAPSGGLINILLVKLGFEPIYFMGHAEYFRTIYVASGVWSGIGWGTIIYLAAIATVDPHLYEAAEMDGAGRWRKMWNVTIPSIVPVIFILLILNVGGLLSTGFEKVFLLYNPAVYETSDIFSTYTYRTGLQRGNFSYATAIGMFNGVTSFILLVLANKLSKKAQDVSLW